jgi:hypothetical protein
MIQEARERSAAVGESTAAWDLAELELHIESGNPEQAQATLARIEQLHLDDPQVAAAVYRLLYETGVISPEDVAAQGHHADAPRPAFAAASPAPVASESASRIWTPDSELPASGGKKSTLWTPS